LLDSPQRTLLLNRFRTNADIFSRRVALPEIDEIEVSSLSLMYFALRVSLAYAGLTLMSEWLDMEA
jgi:hypothetical protein